MSDLTHYKNEYQHVEQLKNDKEKSKVTQSNP